LPRLVREPAGRPFKLAHQWSPPSTQTLFAPVARTAFKRACIPGVVNEAPPKVPPLSQVLYPVVSVTGGPMLSFP